ncbi:MAG TPA: hypothetical protein VJ044_04600, partial [Candidatus Hodarchaeales archaeon]|nr:hypothetical protein [Candidatus Hodarchaeales archaeon]
TSDYPDTFNADAIVSLLKGSELLVSPMWLTTEPAYLAEVLAIVEKHLPCLYEMALMYNPDRGIVLHSPTDGVLTVSSGTELLFDHFVSQQGTLTSTRYATLKERFLRYVSQQYTGDEPISTEIINNMMNILRGRAFLFTFAEIPVFPDEVSVDDCGSFSQLSSGFPISSTPAEGTVLSCTLRTSNSILSNVDVARAYIILPPNSYIFAGQVPNLEVTMIQEEFGLMNKISFTKNPAHILVFNNEEEQRVGLSFVPVHPEHQYVLQDAIIGLMLADERGTPLARSESFNNYGILNFTFALRNLLKPLVDDVAPVTVYGYAAAFK